MIRVRKGAVGIFLREKKFFIMRRAAKRDIGKWEFPGGKVDPGESVAQCLTREMAEETGAQVLAPNLLDVVIQEPRGVWSEQWAIAFCMIPDFIGEPRVMEHVHDVCKWVSFTELKDMSDDLADNARDVIAILQQVGFQ
mgnify:CR=1 FL=1